MSITWFYSCENIDTTDIFDGSDSYPSGFDNTTAFTDSGTWVLDTANLGGSNSIERATSVGSNRMCVISSYADRAGEGCCGFGFQIPSTGGASELLYPFADGYAGDMVQIRGLGDFSTPAGYVDMRWQAPSPGRLTIESGLGNSGTLNLAEDTWYFVVFRWDAVAEDWDLELYDSSGTLLDSGGAASDSTSYASWPTSAADDLVIGDRGGSTEAVYWDNIMFGDTYEDALEDHITADDYDATQGGIFPFPPLFSRKLNETLLRM